MSRRPFDLSLEPLGLNKSQESLITNTMTLQVELQIFPEDGQGGEASAVTEKIRIKEDGVQNFSDQGRKISFHDLKIGPVLGEGTQAKVRKVLHPKSGRLYALKQFVTTENIESMRKLFEIEIRKIITVPYHENLVNSFEAFFRNGHFMILMEYAKHGTLHDIYQRRQTLSDDELQVVAVHLFRGLAHLEKCGVVHRDIKPSNILMSDKGVAKISDFGISTYVNASLLKSTFSSDTAAGSHPYMAPERLQGEEYSFNSDVWSAGLTLAECKLGRYAFGEENKGDSFSLCNQLTDGAQNIVWEPSTSKIFIDFIDRCLVNDPKERPSAKELLNHPFLDECMSNRPLSDLVNTLIDSSK